MPTYDYRCDACEHEFEHFQSMKSPLLRKCPECNKNKLRRLIGAGGGLIFKGSGFYITDYRGDAYQKDKSAENPSSDKKSDSGDKKGQSKDAAPKDSSSAKDSKASSKTGGDAKKSSGKKTKE